VKVLEISFKLWCDVQSETSCIQRDCIRIGFHSRLWIKDKMSSANMLTNIFKESLK